MGNDFEDKFLLTSPSFSANRLSLHLLKPTKFDTNQLLHQLVLNPTIPYTKEFYLSIKFYTNQVSFRGFPLGIGIEAYNMSNKYLVYLQENKYNLPWQYFQEASAVISQFANPVQDQVHDLLANGVVSSGEIIGCILFARLDPLQM